MTTMQDVYNNYKHKHLAVLNLQSLTGPQ